MLTLDGNDLIGIGVGRGGNKGKRKLRVVRVGVGLLLRNWRLETIRSQQNASLESRETRKFTRGGWASVRILRFGAFVSSSARCFNRIDRWIVYKLGNGVLTECVIGLFLPLFNARQLRKLLGTSANRRLAHAHRIIVLKGETVRLVNAKLPFGCTLHQNIFGVAGCQFAQTEQRGTDIVGAIRIDKVSIRFLVDTRIRIG